MSDVRMTLLVLLGAAGFVLLIASANVANLLVARTIARQKEIAARAALGAGASRLLVQFLTESVLLSCSGAVLGVLISLWAVRVIPLAFGSLLPRTASIDIDTFVLLYTALVAGLTAFCSASDLRCIRYMSTSMRF